MVQEDCIQKHENHRMVWAVRDQKDHLVSSPLSRAGTSSTRPGYSKSHPTWSLTLPGVRHPKIIQAGQ